jgi:hypothetical protein
MVVNGRVDIPFYNRLQPDLINRILNSLTPSQCTWIGYSPSGAMRPALVRHLLTLRLTKASLSNVGSRSQVAHAIPTAQRE